MRYSPQAALNLISEERYRQLMTEGYRPSHDMTHTAGQLAVAGACYAIPPAFRFRDNPPGIWPWYQTDWKPSPDNRIRELVKAGALIAAEITRLQNAVDMEPEPSSKPSSSFAWVDPLSGDPCPTYGNVLCTIEDPDHRHVAAHMYFRGPRIKDEKED